MRPGDRVLKVRDDVWCHRHDHLGSDWECSYTRTADEWGDPVTCDPTRKGWPVKVYVIVPREVYDE